MPRICFIRRASLFLNKLVINYHRVGQKGNTLT